jgi:riboflavin kinase/FMN adenylyltransferase
MQVFTRIEEAKSLRNPIVTIGTFDGVHLGHQQILLPLIKKAASLGRDSMIVTFDPHPRVALGQDPPQLLSTLPEKIKLLESIGLNYLLVLPFTKRFSEQTAEDYISQFLLLDLSISEIVIGYDHRFGKDRKGDVQLLRSLLLPQQIEVTEIAAQQVNEITVSSTKIRHALKEGQIEIAGTLLGYNYGFSGRVIHGKRLGRTLGYPTANIEPIDSQKLIPKNGVYVVSCIIDSKVFQGMMNIGNRPTVNNESERSIEVHVLDFHGDLYDKTIEISCLKKIRDEIKFPDLEALKKQLNHDEKISRNFFSLN